jgi:hypothetical protein
MNLRRQCCAANEFDVSARYQHVFSQPPVSRQFRQASQLGIQRRGVGRGHVKQLMKVVDDEAGLLVAVDTCPGCVRLFLTKYLRTFSSKQDLVDWPRLLILAA